MKRSRSFSCVPACACVSLFKYISLAFLIWTLLLRGHLADTATVSVRGSSRDVSEIRPPGDVLHQRHCRADTRQPDSCKNRHGLFAAGKPHPHHQQPHRGIDSYRFRQRGALVPTMRSQLAPITVSDPKNQRECPQCRSQSWPTFSFIPEFDFYQVYEIDSQAAQSLVKNASEVQSSPANVEKNPNQNHHAAKDADQISWKLWGVKLCSEQLSKYQKTVKVFVLSIFTLENPLFSSFFFVSLLHSGSVESSHI